MTLQRHTPSVQPYFHLKIGRGGRTKMVKLYRKRGIISMKMLDKYANAYGDTDFLAMAICFYENQFGVVVKEPS